MHGLAVQLIEDDRSCMIYVQGGTHPGPNPVNGARPSLTEPKARQDRDPEAAVQGTRDASPVGEMHCVSSPAQRLRRLCM